MKGKLIVVCGIDGSGKTSQAQMLHNYLAENKLRVKLLKIISRSSHFFHEVESVLDDMPLQTYCEIVAFERYRRVRRILSPLLKKYDVVICDRYSYTDLAYSKAYGCNLIFLQKLIDRIPTPDLLFLFDLPVKSAMDRIAERGDAWDHQENFQILEKAREAYLELITSFNFSVVDANQSPSEVSRIVIKRTNELLLKSD